jgi:hypothetical protein
VKEPERGIKTHSRQQALENGTLREPHRLFWFSSAFIGLGTGVAAYYAQAFA